MAFEIPVDVDYFAHPKTLDLIAILDRHEADVYPLRLWRWAASYAKDGLLPPNPGPLVERAIGWRGRPGRLFSALVRAGFIDEYDLRTGAVDPTDGTSTPPARAPAPPTEAELRPNHGFKLHDWGRHIGRAIAIYEEKKRKQREKYHRSVGILPEENRTNSPYPILLHPTPSHPGGEKREERPPVDGSKPPDQDPPEDAPAVADGSFEDRMARLWNGQGSAFPLAVEKGRRIIRATIQRGATKQAVEAALMNAPACAGKKLWEVLDPLVKGGNWVDDMVKRFTTDGGGA